MPRATNLQATASQIPRVAVETRTKVRLLITGGVAFAIGLIYLWWARPVSIGEHARRLAYLSVENKPDDVYPYLGDYHERLYGLNREKLRGIWERLVYPRLKGYRLREAPVVETNDDHSQGVAYFDLVNAEGKVFESIQAPFATDDLPATNLYNQLCRAWYAEFVVSKGYPLTTASALFARVKGVEADQAVMEAYGFNSVTDTFGEDPIPWSVHANGLKQLLRTKYRAELESLKLPVP